VFSTKVFLDWAKKNVILVEIDSPRKTQLPSDLKKQNEELKSKFGIRGFPTILFLDASEKKIGQHGYQAGGPEKWVKEAEKQKQKGKDPYVRKPGDSDQVACWRERMGTPEAQQKYKQRSKTEFPNATCRNRGLHQFLVRGLEKVKTTVMWYVLTHNLFRMVALRAERRMQAA
jgi:hypothetical protein